MRIVAAVAVGALILCGPAAVADATPEGRGAEPCVQGSPPPVKARFRDHRLVELRVANPCPDRVVFVSWFLEDEYTESDFDGLVVYPGVRLDWDAQDLKRISSAVRLGLGGDLVVSGTDVIDYCWDTDGSIYQVTTSGVGPGDSCPGG